MIHKNKCTFYWSTAVHCRLLIKHGNALMNVKRRKHHKSLKIAKKCPVFEMRKMVKHS